MKKIGLLVPPGNGTFENDYSDAFHQIARIHTNRVAPAQDHEYEDQDSMDDINRGLERSMEVLSKVQPAIMNYGFTTATFYQGIDAAKSMQNTLSNKFQLPVIFPSLAIVQALEALDVDEISILTPYTEWNNQMLWSFFEGSKYKVRQIKGDSRPKELAKETYLWHQEPSEIIDFILTNAENTSDTVVLPCTAWRTFELVDQLEDRLNKTIVTANQACIWRTSKVLGVEPRSAGRLFNY